MLPLSLEALEDLAERVRATATSAFRAMLAGEAEAVLPPIDATRLARAYPSAHATEPALGVLLAEAVASETMRRAQRKYDQAWTEYPIALPGERAVAWRAFSSALIHEPNSAQRVALAAAGEKRANEHLAAARTLVDAWRGIATELGLDRAESLLEAVGLGAPAEIEAAAASVLDATSGAYQELESWMRARVGFARTGELRWDERLRMLYLPRATEILPGGDRAGIASRWWTRVGLDAMVSRVRDETLRASPFATDIYATSERLGTGATIAGTPAVSARGVVDFTAALGEAVALCAPSEPRAALRAGRDRLHGALWHVVARRMFIEPTFVTREAAVDRGQREPVLLECLWNELFVTRLDACMARFSVDVITRAGDLPARLRESLTRALGSSPAPAWAAHWATRTFEQRATAHTIAAVLEPRIRNELRDLHDEDWFRNPRAGETLSARMTALRTQGLIDWAAGDGERRLALDGQALARRVADALADARK